MMPILFHLGSLPIFSFGVLMSLAFVVAGWVMQRDFARKREPRELAGGRASPKRPSETLPLCEIASSSGLSALRGVDASRGRCQSAPSSAVDSKLRMEGVRPAATRRLAAHRAAALQPEPPVRNEGCRS